MSHFAFSQSADSKSLKQPIQSYDTLYIKSYHDKIITRMFYSQKFSNLSLSEANSDVDMEYESNTSLNLGIGTTIKSFTFNFSYGFKFLNPESGQSKTRFLDLQTSIYTRKFIIDFFGQYYRGLFLTNTAEVLPDYPEEEYYERPDIHQQIVGLNAHYVFNNKRFSYRAPFVHNERQLKSAGTFLAGIEGYYGSLKGDSTIVPKTILNRGAEVSEEVNEIKFFQIGPNGGYAYSLVMWQRFFATLSLTVSMTYGYSSAVFENRGLVKRNDINFGALARFAIGYNDDNWFLGFSLVNNGISNTNSNEDVAATLGIGVYKFNFAWRFNSGPKINKITRYIP